MRCNARVCPFINEIGYCRLTGCIRMDLAEKYNKTYSSNSTTAGVPTETSYTIHSEQDCHTTDKGKHIIDDVIAENTPIGAYDLLHPSRICSICNTPEREDAKTCSSEFWICDECICKIGKLIGVRTDRVS